MGIFKKDEMLLDFKGGRTEDFSSTIPYLNKLNTDAKMLVNQLGPNMNEINRKRLVLVNESEQLDLYKLFEKSTTLDNNNNNFSETSPFISSDVYNQLLNKNISNQLGGARNEDHDDENESSTSSSSFISESDSDKKNRKKIIKKFKKNSDSDKVKLDDDDEKDAFSARSVGSYLSSSAHTDGSDNSANSEDSENSENSESYKSNSFTSSTVSIRNHKSRNHNYSDSVDTSDINILSLDN